MNLVNSYGWLEYITNGENVEFFAPALENLKALVVLTICLYAVYRRICQQKTEDEALHAIALMQQGNVVDSDFSLYFSCSQISINHKK